jgi:hypothetical protein
MNPPSDRGARFWKCDFQIHTLRDAAWSGPFHPVNDRTSFAEALVGDCRSKGVQAVAITDHHDLCLWKFIHDAAQREPRSNGSAYSSGERLIVFPGVEITLATPSCQALLIAPGATVVYIGDAENKFLHLDALYLNNLGVVIAPAAKMPDVAVHDTQRNWLLLIEAVTSAGPVDGKRRKELKDLFKGCKAGLVFVTAFEDRQAFGRLHHQISWESEVWIAEAPDHIIHFNGERFLGPYPDVMPPSN